MHHANSSPREAWLFTLGGSLALGSHSCSFSGLNCKSQMIFMPSHFASCRYSKRTVGRAAAANKQFLSKVWDCHCPLPLLLFVSLLSSQPKCQQSVMAKACSSARRSFLEGSWEQGFQKKSRSLSYFLKTKRIFAPQWYGEHIQDGVVSLQ